MTKVFVILLSTFLFIQISFAGRFSGTTWESRPEKINSKITLEIYDDDSWLLSYQKTGETVSGDRIKIPINYVHDMDFLDLIYGCYEFSLIVNDNKTLYFYGNLLYKVEK